MALPRPIPLQHASTARAGAPRSAARRDQRGGFFLGAVFGLLVGLAVALGVALYVNKVPIPFVDKVPQRTAEQDAAETEKNRSWDPNAPLYGKNPAKPASAPANAAVGAGPAAAAASAASAQVAGQAASAPSSRAAAAAAVREAASKALSKSEAAPAAEKAASARSAGDAFMYYVQVGAYTRSEDAEVQRAKLGMSGLVGRVTEREQAGKLMYRVRVGPFESRDEADGVKDQAVSAGYGDATLVRVQR